MSMQFEMLRSFNNNCELLRYIRNTIKNWKQKWNLFSTQYAFYINAYSFFVVGGRGEGGLLKIPISRRRAY